MKAGNRNWKIPLQAQSFHNDMGKQLIPTGKQHLLIKNISHPVISPRHQPNRQPGNPVRSNSESTAFFFFLISPLAYQPWMRSLHNHHHPNFCSLQEILHNAKLRVKWKPYDAWGTSIVLLLHHCRTHLLK